MDNVYNVMVVSNYNMGKTQKVIVCGSKGCGKTSILEKAIYDNNGVSLSLANMSFLKIFIPTYIVVF